MSSPALVAGLLRFLAPVALILAAGSLAGCAGPGAAGGSGAPHNTSPPQQTANPRVVDPRYSLVIERPRSLRSSSETDPVVMENLVPDLIASLGSSKIFREVLPPEQIARSNVDLRLLPVLVSAQRRNKEPNVVVDVTMRFDLVWNATGGVVWSAPYSETSPSEALFRSLGPLAGRQQVVAGRAIRQRIIERLRVDLAKIVLAY